MALISFSSASGTAGEYAGFDTTITRTWTNTGVAGRNQCAVVVTNLVAATGASNSVSASYGGVAMTQRFVQSWAANGRVAMFSLVNPPSGSQTVSVSWSSLGGSIPSKQVSHGVAVYNNVSEAVYGQATNSNTSSCSTSTETQSSGDTLVFGHARLSATAFTSYNQTQRFTGATTYGRILIGDNVPGGAGSYTSTATMSAGEVWGAGFVYLRRFAKSDFFAG